MSKIARGVVVNSVDPDQTADLLSKYCIVGYCRICQWGMKSLVHVLIGIGEFRLNRIYPKYCEILTLTNSS